MDRGLLFKSILPVLALALGAWLLTSVGTLAPEGRARQQALLQMNRVSRLNAPGQESDPALHDTVIAQEPVVPAVVHLADVAPGSGGATGQETRWQQGLIDLENEMLGSPAEMAALREAALALPPQPEAAHAGPRAPQALPERGVHFDAIPYPQSGGFTPPDPEMAAGPAHLIAAVNVAFQIYDKAGQPLTAATSFADLFATDTSGRISSNCKLNGPFDPNVLYDEAADRFILGIDGDGASYCMAVSRSGDPTQGWYLYEFPTNVSEHFFDFPHAGVGRDAIYVGANMFSGSSLAEGRVWAFDKSALYAGQPASFVSRSTGLNDTPQPLKLHGFQQGTWPAAGPHYVLTSAGFNGRTYALYTWDDPFGRNEFRSVAVLDIAAAHGVAVGHPVNNLQKDGGRYRANDYRALDFEYRDGYGWTTMTVACNPGAGTVNCVQWAQIELARARITQAGIFASNGDYRSFPDLAANRCGDMVVGYTKSNSASYPGVWAAGRSSGDAAGTLAGEIELKAGEVPYQGFDGDGSDNDPYRWGDYTGMTIDPDGATFWYLGQYSRDHSESTKWGTYISAMTMPGCFELDRQSEQIAAPGATVTHILTLTNAGTADSYEIAVTGSAWPATLLTASTLSLASGESAEIRVAVEAPNISSGSDSLTLSATSAGSPTALQEATVTTEVQATAAPALAPPPLLDGAPGETVTHTLTVANSGNYTDTYAITVSGNAWAVDAPPSVGPVAPGASATFPVAVVVGSGTADSADLRVTSTLDGATEASVTLTTVSNLLLSHTPQVVAPRETVIHTIVLSNDGERDSFTVAIDAGSWPTTLVSEAEITVAAGDSAEILVAVEAPNAPVGSDTFTVRLRSTSRPEVALAVEGRTVLQATAAITLSPLSQQLSVQPGGTVNHTVVVTNSGNYTDIFHITLSGHQWLSQAPASSGFLAPGASATIAVQVTAGDGVQDVATATFVSGLDDIVRRSATLETVKMLHASFLPVIRMPDGSQR
ncbi:MAG: hypothetical protein R3272_08970 [Candidatus Promineifilaceae bacterium]|nr:hypothetical protein [Candidatus Promineifilaceae bacterium]